MTGKMTDIFFYNRATRQSIFLYKEKSTAPEKLQTKIEGIVNSSERSSQRLYTKINEYTMKDFKIVIQKKKNQKTFCKLVSENLKKKKKKKKIHTNLQIYTGRLCTIYLVHFTLFSRHLFRCFVFWVISSRQILKMYSN